MATGPEHYREAQEFAARAVREAADALTLHLDGKREKAAWCMEWAKHAREMGLLHATLADAAATALLGPVTVAGVADDDLLAWNKTAGVSPPASAPEEG